jgi:hypothetical protein
VQQHGGLPALSRPTARPGPRAVALALGLAACDGAAPRECLPGDFERCTCDDGRDGFSQCDAEGASYGACGRCGQTALGGAGPGGAGPGGTGGGLVGFLEPCEVDEDCETGLCHSFNAKGRRCSRPCDDDADCESPSPGCNMMGVCKAP